MFNFSVLDQKNTFWAILVKKKKKKLSKLLVEAEI